MHIFYQIWHSKYINSDTFTFFTWSVVFSFSGHNTKLCPVSRITNLDSFSGFQWRVSCEGENVVKVVKISQLIDVIVTTIIWLKYCSYCIQPYPINQSINQSNNIKASLTKQNRHYKCTIIMKMNREKKYKSLSSFYKVDSLQPRIICLCLILGLWFRREKTFKFNCK